MTNFSCFLLLSLVFQWISLCQVCDEFTVKFDETSNGDAICEDKVTYIGGWKGYQSDLKLSSNRCNIDKIKAKGIGLIDMDLFDSYVRNNKPVIIEGLTTNHHFAELCTRENLLENFGDQEIILSTANTHSYDKTKSTLSDYIENHMHPQTLSASADKTLYHFGDNRFDTWEGFIEYYVRPPLLNSLSMGLISFGLGGSGSGVPFHTHGPVFAEVIYGKKRWFLTEPDHRPIFEPDETSLYWLETKYNKTQSLDDIYECVLTPFQILYLPGECAFCCRNYGYISICTISRILKINF